MKNIYVGNLDLMTTAESLRSLFKPIGAAHKLKLILNGNTNLSRGFAFIEMTDPAAEKAIATLNGRSLDGRVIDVHEGRPRIHRRASPGLPILPDASPDGP